MILSVSVGFAQKAIPLNPPIPNGFGVNIHFTNPHPGEIREMAAAGVRWIRTDLSWQGTEHVQGQYDFSAYDRLLKALHPYHIRAILIFDYANKLYDGGVSPHTDLGRQAFARWAVAAVRHFDGSEVVWEMYNEPNGTFWKPQRNDQDYIMLALTVGKGLKESVPDATLIGPATALIDLPFLKSCFQAGLLNYWKAVSVHPYRMRPPESAAPEYAALRKLIQSFAPRGATIPIIAGEWGYPSSWFWQGMNNVLQANFLAREFLSDEAAGVPITMWYDWHDDGSDPNNQEDTFGLVKFPYHEGARAVFAPKPDYFALRTISRMLRGCQFRRRIAAGTAEDYILLFTKGGESRLVAWTAAREPHRVEIPVASASFLATGVEGSESHTRDADQDKLRLTLTDSPQYLVPSP